MAIVVMASFSPLICDDPLDIRLLLLLLFEGECRLMTERTVPVCAFDEVGEVGGLAIAELADDISRRRFAPTATEEEV